jgi:phosphate transport system permease protein
MNKKFEQFLQKRYRKEKSFKLLGVASIGFSIAFLAIFFIFIFSKANSAFFRTEIALDIDFTEKTIVENCNQGQDIALCSYNILQMSSSEIIDSTNYRALIKQAIKERFNHIKDISELNSIYQLISKIAPTELKNYAKKNPDILKNHTTLWFSASSKADIFFKHNVLSSLNDRQIAALLDLQKENKIRKVFNWKFFQFADSREPEIAGVKASIVGSFLTMIIFLLCAFPVAVLCALYLEEFAPKNRITDLLEISINNLAAIPSIIYGLLGLTIYLQYLHIPRSSSLVGGMTLFMLVLPIIIIATRNAIRAIPTTIREAAMSLGASKMQVAFHHIFPLSIPGIMTGTILAVARALGETAPLLMIGMVAFIADVPQNMLDPTTVLPVQIYLWSDSQEIGFQEKTSAAILALLGFLVMFNLFAIILRKKFERKW